MFINGQAEQVELLCCVINQSMQLNRLARRAALLDVLLEDVKVVVLHKEESSLPAAIIRNGSKEVELSALFIATSMAVQGAAHVRPCAQQGENGEELHLTIAAS